MPRPSQVHRDAALEQISVAFMPQGLIAQELSPTVKVKKESNEFFVYSKDNLRIPATLWADGDVANPAIWNLSFSSYLMERHALKDTVTDRTRANADKAVRPEIDTTEGMTGQLKLRNEIDVLTLITTATLWSNTTSLSSTQRWDQDTSLANPIRFVDSATIAIRRNSGKKANVIAMPDNTFKAAKEHTNIVDRVKHTSMQSVGPDILATLFNVERVLISGAVQNSAEEGLDDSLADLMTDTVFVGFVERSPGLKKPSALYTFSKDQQFMVERFRDDEKQGDTIRVSTFFDNKIVSSDCGYLIVDTIT